MDLVAKGDVLGDEVAAVAGQELELGVERVGLVLEEAEAVDGGAMDGGEVGVVGLVAGIGGLSELLGGEGMDDPDLEPGVSEGGLDRRRGTARCVRRRRSRPRVGGAWRPRGRPGWRPRSRRDRARRRWGGRGLCHRNRRGGTWTGPWRNRRRRCQSVRGPRLAPEDARSRWACGSHATDDHAWMQYELPCATTSTRGLGTNPIPTMEVWIS